MNKIFLVFLLCIESIFALNIEQEFNIKTIQVVSKNISNYKEYYGKIEPDTSKVFDINLRFDGFVTKLYLCNPYTFVKKTDKLFDIYSQTVYNLYDELKIASTKSQHLQNSIEKKFQLLNIDPKNKTQNDSTTIQSDFQGFVTKININEGSYVNKGETIFEITDLSKVWAIVNIYQQDLRFIKKEQEVLISVDGVDEKFSGKIDTIYKEVNPKDQTIAVKIILENKEFKLFPNMFLKAKIFEDSKKIIFIPTNAVVQRDGKQYVFTKHKQYYQPIQIQVKKTLQGYEVLSGLAEGQTIVTNALFLLDSDALTNGLYSDDW